nr:DUF533 domain-containing protein [Photobacterium sanguinicancri]
MKSLMDQLLGQATKLMDSGKSAAVSSSSNKTDLLKGAVGGGLIGTLLGNKKSRKMVSKYGTKAAMVGGTAVAGTLAYQPIKSGSKISQVNRRLLSLYLRSRLMIKPLKKRRR